MPVTPSEPTGRAIAAALSRLSGVSAPRSTRVFTHGIQSLWANYQWVRHMGPAVMAEPQTFLRLLRRLTDRIFEAVAPDARLLVEYSPDYVGALPLIRSVYPDALLLDVDGSTAADDVAAIPVSSMELARSSGELERLARALGLDPPSDDVLAAHSLLGTVEGGREGSPTARTGTAAGPRRRVRAPAPERHSPLRDRLVVIVGCGRSGTTWLESLLMAHPLLGGMAETETWLFHQLERLWGNLRSGAGLDSHLDEAALAGILREFCDGMFQEALAVHDPDATYFVEKSPVHSWCLRNIAAVYPDAWFVHLVRDGRDVARSITQVPFFETPRLEDAAAMWSTTVDEVCARSASLERFREMRYETLFDDPFTSTADLVRWVGLNADQETEDRLRTVAARRVSTHAGTASPVGPGRWKQLSSAEQARIYAGAGRTLLDFGYANGTDLRRARRHPAYLAAKLHLNRPF